MNVEKILEVLFRLVEHQENININFTVEKKEGGEDATIQTPS